MTEEAPQSLSNPEILTESEKRLREEMLRIQNDPTLSASERAFKVAQLSRDPLGEMGRADLYGRDISSRRG